MNDESTFSLILADDHEIVRDALVAHLQAYEHLRIIGVAGTGASALELIEKQAPDLALLDLSMPQGSGLWVAREVQRSGAKTRLVLLTSLIDDAVVEEARSLGILAIVQKAEPTEVLLQALAHAASGDPYMSPTVSAESSISALTPREKQILCLVCDGHTSLSISSALSVSKRTVDAHRRNIMEKVGVESVAELIRYAIRVGLIPA